jgi:uncharacterized protein YbjT (DUF2867 family)
MKLKVIVTGATGMVGEGVLHECLQHPDISHVLVLSRKTCGIAHPKLTEVLHSNFFDLSPVENQLSGYDACYFCLGVSSVGVKEEEFSRMTYDLTMHAAQTLSRRSPSATFCYVSGAGTDSTEKGSMMWARVKGRTENALLKVPFKAAYMFRPGYMQPTPGLKNTLGFYKWISWMYPVIKLLMPGRASTLGELGRAMIHVTTRGYNKNILEVKDIVALAK